MDGDGLVFSGMGGAERDFREGAVYGKMVC